jgi:polygalacturonase
MVKIFISAAGLALLAFLFPNTKCIAESWNEVEKILKKINPPQFPDQFFNVIDFGAVADDQSLSTEAINAAILACHSAGGGIVIIPAGQFLTGAINLKSNVNLHISEGAVLKFSSDENDYLPMVHTRWEGTECYNYSPFIYAYGLENIAITGKGILDGNGTAGNWWGWTERKYILPFIRNQALQTPASNKLRTMANNKVPVEDRQFGPGHFLRPNFIQFYKCRNILIEGITVIDPPMWAIHPVLSENITVRNISVISNGPNTDGCNPESSRNVLIENSYFSTGNDCIAIKSGRDADGRRINVPSENIIIRNCVMHNGFGGVVIGSEVSGNVRNVFVEDCVMDSPEPARVLRIKTNSMRGGIVENIFMRNIRAGQLKRAVLYIDYHYKEGDRGKMKPVVRNIRMENITAEKAPRAVYINAYRRAPVSDIYILNSSFRGIQKKDMIRYVENFRTHNVYINDQPRVASSVQ